MITGVKLLIPGLHLILSYREAVLLHKGAGFAMAASFLVWLFYSMATGTIGKYYLLRARDVKGFHLQALYYAFGVFTGGANPFPTTKAEKFNPLQKMSYLSIMFVFTPVIVSSGIFYSDIMFFRGAVAFVGGLRILDAIHLAAAYIFATYLIVHAYMSTMGRTPLSHVFEMFHGRADHEETTTEQS